MAKPWRDAKLPLPLRARCANGFRLSGTRLYIPQKLDPRLLKEVGDLGLSTYLSQLFLRELRDSVVRFLTYQNLLNELLVLCVINFGGLDGCPKPWRDAIPKRLYIPQNL